MSALSFANAGSKEPIFLCSLYRKTCLSLESGVETLQLKNSLLHIKTLPITERKKLEACFVIIDVNCKFVHFVKVQE
jgi:hypothetical protein